jgi:hypothetical protein
MTLGCLWHSQCYLFWSQSSLKDIDIFSAETATYDMDSSASALGQSNNIPKCHAKKNQKASFISHAAVRLPVHST